MAKRKRGDSQSKNDATSKTQDTSSGETATVKDNVESKFAHFTIPFEDKMITCARKGQDKGPGLIFTHGAGGGVDSPAMTEFLHPFPTYACFQGNMNLKSRVRYFHAVTQHFGSYQALGGRSMGARAAVVTALEMDEKPEALILVSYPLTGGKGGQERQPEQREQILLNLPDTIDVLFAIGSQDNMCDLDSLREIMQRMKARSWLLELKGADHGTSLKHKAGVQPMREAAGNVAAKWLEKRDESKRYCAIAWDPEEERVTTQGWENLDIPTPMGGKKRKKQS